MRKACLILGFFVLSGSTLLFNGNTCFANTRIPFCKSFTVAPEANQVILTVPENKQFVLLKLYADYDDYQHFSGYSPTWHLDIDNQVLLAGNITSYSGGLTGGVYDDHVQVYNRTNVHDFPDSCVVVPAGKSLIAVNARYPTSNQYALNLTVIGYFAKPQKELMADVNGDGKVNLFDFAIMANEWLTAYE